MQSDVNLHKVDKIFDCNIIYVMFLVVCNSIVDKKIRKCVNKMKEYTFKFYSKFIN